MKQKKIGGRIERLVALIMWLGIMSVGIICILMFYMLIMDMMEQQCVSGTNMLAYQLEREGSTGDQTQLLDELKEQTGYEFTIFHGDERAYTTVMQDGKRAVGTKLGSELSAVVLNQGESYVGEADILGTAHLCSYVPTKDENGQIDGLIFCGISMGAVYGQMETVLVVSLIAEVFFILLSIVIMGAFIKKHVSRPLGQLTNVARCIEQGELGLGENNGPDFSLCSRSNDEIGFLSQAFEHTAQALCGYIGEISSILGAIADGDLTVCTTREYTGDFASIRESLDHILLRLRDTMSQTRENSRQVLDKTDRMSASAQTLSQGATEQASAVEELSTTVSAISERISSNAEHSREASGKTHEMGMELEQSRKQMDLMLVSMQEISRFSDEIEKIVNLIDNIAFQTNILALNAAIEASHVGEVGRGFAVVADEVRALAVKSAEASKNTAELIEKSVQAVHKGMQVAEDTETSIDRLTTLSKTTAELIDEISDTSEEQAKQAAEVSLGITQISGVVQSNSAMARESAVISEELAKQAGVLEEMIERFRL